MLNRGFFAQTMTDLAEAFGISERRLDRLKPVYFKFLEDRISDRQLAQTAELLLLTGEKFPTVKELLEASRNFPEHRGNTERSLCDFCDSSGLVRASSISDNIIYYTIFKCPYCLNCQYDYPVWGKKWEREGYTIGIVPNYKPPAKRTEMPRHSTTEDEPMLASFKEVFEGCRVVSFKDVEAENELLKAFEG